MTCRLVSEGVFEDPFRSVKVSQRGFVTFIVSEGKYFSLIAIGIFDETI